MRNLEKLPKGTRDLLVELSRANGHLDDFVLVGGTAITLNNGHRISEDLDFCAYGPKLDRPAVKSIIETLQKNGHQVLMTTDPSQSDEWADSGLDLLDYQQDYQVDGVKLTFFSGSNPKDSKAVSTYQTDDIGAVKVMSDEGLFEMKSRLLMRRTSSRDLYDLWYYLERADMPMQKLHEFMEDEAGCKLTWDQVRQKLLPERLPITDPGFEQLVLDGPESFEGLKAALERQCEAHELKLAEDAILTPPEPRLS